MNSDSPFLSVIVATYNVKNHIDTLITSLNNQSFTNYEVLISDGGSTDGSLSLINDQTIRNLAWSKSARDGGIYYALNEGLAHAKGTWVIILGADDRFIDDHVMQRFHDAVATLSSDRKFVYGNLEIRSDSGKRIKEYPHFPVFEKRYEGCPPIHHQTAVIKNECFKLYGNFDTAYLVHADYELMCRIMEYEKPLKIPVALVSFHDGGFSSNWKTIKRSLQEMTAIRKKYHCNAVMRIYLPYLRILATKTTSIFTK